MGFSLYARPPKNWTGPSAKIIILGSIPGSSESLPKLLCLFRGTSSPCLYLRCRADAAAQGSSRQLSLCTRSCWAKPGRAPWDAVISRRLLWMCPSSSHTIHTPAASAQCSWTNKLTLHCKNYSQCAVVSPGRELKKKKTTQKTWTVKAKQLGTYFYHCYVAASKEKLGIVSHHIQ